MRSLIIIIAVLAVVNASVAAQDRVIPNKPYSSMNSGPGYITFNEATIGIGLGDVSVPYSKSFFGFNTIHGYQVNRYFVISAGTGVSFYNGGTMIPVFLDLRYRIHIDHFTPYLFGDGGLLLGAGGSGESKMFLNPGAGIRYALSNKFALNLGAGLFVQTGETMDSFVNIKLGITYKPK